ncbi:unnamed protein product [marine sediment metagenome]|uniref:HEPN domain-containing protein n=1 Tax=marine sediment metagenome TaxID=412755 RepID=X0YG91_9ZZZZ
MQRKDKVKIQELIDYWKHRAQKYRESGHYRLATVELLECVNQLEKLLNGQPTETSGFKPPK